jgi:O-methyltransferase
VTTSVASRPAVEGTAEPLDDLAGNAPLARWPRLRRFLWNYGPKSFWMRLRPLDQNLNPERYAIFLRALAQRRELPGAIVEVGCFRGKTAADAYRSLKDWGHERRYVCIDTFEGFVPEQFEEDRKLGTNPTFGTQFSFNTRRSVERMFKRLGYEQIEVVQGDIVEMPESNLPEQISVCLMDVDLAIPIHEGLRKIYPRLAPGGVALVDDCEEEGETDWAGARVGYKRFVEETGLPERYDGGFGIVETPAA